MTKRQTDFLELLLEMMQKTSERQDKRLDELNEKIDKNTETTNKVLIQAKATNGQVLRHDAEIKELQKKQGTKLASISPGVIYLIALGAVILLTVVGSLLGVDLKGIFK